MIRNKNQKLFHLVVVFLFFLMFFPKIIYGVVLYIEPESSIRKINDFLVLEIKVNVQEECINAIKVELFFPRNLLQGKYFSDGGSILSLWPEPPHIDNEKGLFSFVGGVPGGYCEENTRTKKEDSVLIGSLIFETKQVREETVGEIFFSENSQILINDGLATPATLNKKKSFFVVIPEVQLNPVDPWEKKIAEDEIKPEIFYAEVRSDPFIFNGKHILLFYAIDKHSGMDYYLVSEQKRFGFLPIQKEKWEKTESPHLLKDQRLRSIIKLKAVDMAGNEKIKIIRPLTGWQDIVPWIIVLIAITGIVFLKRKNKN